MQTAIWMDNVACSSYVCALDFDHHSMAHESIYHKCNAKVQKNMGVNFC